MAVSAKSKDRKSKVEAFKQQAKEQAKKEAIPKTHLIPLTEWGTTDVLDIRGDILEALENQMVLTYQALQKSAAELDQAQVNFQNTGRVLQMIVQQNIKAEKIKVKYVWNNGEDATDQDVTDFQKQMEDLKELQQQKVDNLKSQENAAKTGLVGPDGNPVGTNQNLDEEIDDKTEKEEIDTKF